MGTQLLGKGKVVRGKDRQAVSAAVQSFISKSRPEGWQLSDVTQQCSNMREHKHADVPGVGSVACTAYGRARTRVSYYVLHTSGTGPTGTTERWLASSASYWSAKQASSPCAWLWAYAMLSVRHCGTAECMWRASPQLTTRQLPSQWETSRRY